MCTRVKQLLKQISQCEECIGELPKGCRPIVSASRTSRLVIIGQAPGIRVHQSGIPWNDPSGENLRRWLTIDSDTFYNPDKVALIPMGFCFPGSGKSGDLPPDKRCAPLWHPQLFEQLPINRLTLLVGMYAQKYYLPNRKKTLTETVRSFQNYLPENFPLPHPSPRNNIWQKKNPWFQTNILPELRSRVQELSL